MSDNQNGWGNRDKIELIIRALALFLVTIITLYSAHAGAEETTTMTVLCQRGSIVNIRSSASTKGDPTGYLYLGDTFEVSKTQKDAQGRTWGYCGNLGTEAGEGWVCMFYLVDGEGATVYEDGISGTIRANGRVQARKSPGGERRKWLSVGDKVTVYAECGEWSVTNKGYVKSEYIATEEAQ